MLKRILLVLLGAAAALEAERWLERAKTRYRPSVVTGTLLDRVNERLEEKRGKDSAPSDTRA